MPDKYIQCSCCKKIVNRDTGRINEGKKFGWKTYCSLKCLGLSRRKRKVFICSREGCKNTFFRTTSDLKKSRQFYCSLRCAAIANNKKYPKHFGVRKKCLCCGEIFVGNKKFCSVKCKFKGQIKSKKEILGLIQTFYKQNGRIPLKREITFCHAARGGFGNWNNAIKAAGFDPNLVMFANKHMAKDGHECDSFTEKIIDDWMFERSIKHKRDVPYPGNKGFTCDFVVGNKWIEFFGLSGQLRKYDELKRKKLNLVKKYGIYLIKIFPNDIFPKNKLGLILGRR